MSKARKGQVLRMPIAHSEGRYVVDEPTLKVLEKEKRIVLRYCGPNGEIEDRYNANGSIASIAAITNEKGNVMALMPHPERCSEEILGNTDGLTIFRSIEAKLFGRTAPTP